MKSARIRPPHFVLFILLIVTSVALGACGAPAPAAPATGPAAPVATNAPAEPTQVPLGEVLLKEDFVDNSNNWALRSDADVVSVIEGGKLTSRLTTLGKIWTFKSPVTAEEVDVSVDVEFAEGSSPENLRYGFVCQYVDVNNFIWVAVSPAGTYSIQKKINGEWTALVPFSRSSLIKRELGSVNHLRVICSEGHITLFINDALVADVVDTSLSGGSFRLMVNATASNKDDTNPVAASFSNLIVRKPLAWAPPAQILLSDSFDNDKNGWGLSEEDAFSVRIQDGHMVFGFQDPDYYSWSLPALRISNVDMSFDVNLLEGTPSNTGFGAFCRYLNADNYYDFSLSGDGYYRLGKVVNGAWEVLIDWAPTTAIKQGAGETNRIRVVCSGSNLSLYANDQLLFTAQDTTLTAAGFALLARRFTVDDVPVAVAFDNLEVKYP